MTGIWSFNWVDPDFIWIKVDTTESSVEDTNSFSISDQSFLSAISGEVVDDSSLVSQSSQQQPSFYRTPSLRKNSSHEVVRQKPDLPPKPQHLAKAQMQVNISQWKHLSFQLFSCMFCLLIEQLYNISPLITGWGNYIWKIYRSLTKNSQVKVKIFYIISGTENKNAAVIFYFEFL